MSSPMAARLQARVSAMSARDGGAATLRQFTEVYNATTRQTARTPTDTSCRALLAARVRKNVDGTVVRTEEQELSLTGLANTVVVKPSDKVLIGSAVYLVKTAERSSPDGSVTIAWMVCATKEA